VFRQYKAGAKDFEHYVEWMRYNLKWFTDNWPGVEYPFPVMTAIRDTLIWNIR
jgi:hypothetical protein